MENLSKAFSLLAFAYEDGPSASPPPSSSVLLLLSSSEKERGIRSKSVKNMKLKKAKEANQDIGAIKTPYLTNQEEFINETGFLDSTLNKSTQRVGFIPKGILQHLNLPFLEPICFKSQRLVFYTLGCDLAICFINQKLPKAPRIFPKLSRYKQLNTFPILAEILSFKPNG
ncbi:hypothetical protein F2Q70_00008992 [Brassica cretica]|uniref:Uncharacterized protein n=2 Tax=Brassica cretica TaxID=69181 RepID=A0A8S9J5K0_BRACR|nr:hypothetical protein F2Q68_00002056 [Brassica cretica]KAF2615383.1 hypothetical protein F2Q70_00008992 [Brassica cretica]KAF3547315.1 hypothetical protein DY000_02002744 [Brassica cretica]